MPVNDFWAYTLSITKSKHNATSTFTVFTPSGDLVQAGISMAADLSSNDASASCSIQSVDIPGFGSLTLPAGTTTVRYVLDSVTFLLSADYQTARATAFLATQSE